METKKDLKYNKYNQIVLSSKELRELLLQGKSINNLIVDIDNDIELYFKYKDDIICNNAKLIANNEEIDLNDFYENCSNQWNIPKEYDSINVKEWLYKKCINNEQISRVYYEYNLYEDKGLVQILKLFIFLVDYMRKNNFIWGVGRGSSVNSYILYLIGIHKINSLFYNLQIEDFLK